MDASGASPSWPAVSAVSAAASSQGDRVTLTGEAFASHAAVVAARCEACRRVALWAEPILETIVAIAGAWNAGTTMVPINPALGSTELTHVLETSRPDAIVAAAGTSLPEPLTGLQRIAVELGPAEAPEAKRRSSHPATATRSAIILFTSGTTGPPKGAVLSAGAVAANLHGLREAWQWTADDVLVHALPLFHVHGLVLGVLGPLYAGGGLVHVGRFSPGAVAHALHAGGTMLFGVPTMYHRLVEAAADDRTIVEALRGARLLVSGSAALARRDADRIQALTGRVVIERYGLTETLIACATPAGRVRPGTVGPPVPGVDVRLVDDRGVVVNEADTLGEIEIRGPCLFDGYLGQPDATARALARGWFRTGDTAARTPEGDYRIVGRTSLDIIKTGGFKVGAGEIEDVLRQHPDVGDVAVTGEADADLGQRIVAWVEAAPGATPDLDALAAHVAAELAPYKRPRAVHIVDRLPRTALGKVEKHRLIARGQG